MADDLTTTEFTMAMLACRGWTNAEIARHMGVSPGTVKTACPACMQSLASELAPSWSRICC
ncbi:MAG: LuxR C-terminal-related transcriptional regulator [Collinsella aerofaciens]